MFQSLVQSALPLNKRNRRVLRLPVRDRRDRSGAAVVEAAFCIPIVIILMLGTLEVCSGIYLAESIKVSAYEAVRVGVRRRATAEQVYERAMEALKDRQVSLPRNASGQELGVIVTPANFSGLKSLDPIRVTITAPTRGNSMYIFDTLYNRNVTASVSMVREFDE